jgi:N-dimethylarginine dimethylaminohydrolase
VQGILRDYGFTVLPIDCTQIILTQSGIHCISKTIPAARMAR